jgi:cytochrome b561
MATNCGRARPSFAALADRAAAIAAQWFVALSVLAVGVAGVLGDSWQQPATRVNMHTLFGVLLLLAVIAKFAWHARHAALRNALAVAACARLLTRQLYVLLYVLAGVKEIQYFLPLFRTAGTLNAPEVSLADSMKVLQFYLAYGFLALALIWMITALCNYFSNAIPPSAPMITTSNGGARHTVRST